MLLSRDKESKIIKRLKEKNLLAGSFIFFGESQVGKFAFADEFTRELEGNPFVCQERLIIYSGESKIGIDAIREIKSFLRKRPVMSAFRTVIIKDANKMTPEAQNAALKIVEEPPSYALIIFIARGIDNILPTLASRLRRLYFPRFQKHDIISWLMEYYGVLPKEAENIAKISFGAPGFALQILNDTNVKKTKSFTIPKKFNSAEEYDEFMKKYLVKLYHDKNKNSAILKKVLRRIELSSRFNTNKKLQIQSVFNL